MSNRRKPGLKKSNVPVEYTRDMIIELQRCAADPVYFIKNYVYIKHATRGRIKFNMYDYQEAMVRKFHKLQFNIILSARQTGKTETSCAFLLWCAIFKPDQTILVASNKSSNAMEIISKIQYAYEELPAWIKPGIDENSWNKHECKFDNKSRIVATTTSSDSGRGMAISLLYCDEFAFVKPHISREFYDSILPTISTGGSMIISSTPNGDVGQYATLWKEAEAGLNEFKHGITRVRWDEPPGRDEAFKKKFMGLLGERKWRQEYECEFLTEELTLIDGDVVRKSEVRINERIKASEHIKLSLNNDKYKLFEIPQKGSIYMISVDPSTGNGRDNGVVQVFEFPSMVQVMEYTSNTLSPHVLYTELKSIIQFFERFSDEVYFTVENNGVGQGIIAAYEGDMNPPNAMLVSENGKLGFTTTLKSKTRACLQFKDLYERGKMVINSIDLLTELKSFIRSSTSGYSAQVGATDDRVMAIIIMFYIIQEISNSNASAYDMVYTVASEIEERHGWKPPSAENEDPPDTSRVGLGVLTNVEQPRSEQLTDLFSSFKRW